MKLTEEQRACLIAQFDGNTALHLRFLVGLLEQSPEDECIDDFLLFRRKAADALGEESGFRADLLRGIRHDQRD